MRDFSLTAYGELVEGLVSRYRVLPVNEFLVEEGPEPTACLRHDVDRRVENALACAEVARSAGARGTFYFRVPFTSRPEVMRSVHELGHEVGYHYETLSKYRGDMETAVRAFADELAELRRTAPVTTACMHGAPLARWDNRDIWQATTLGEHGLLGEPYLSVDFTRVGYLTDTGRAWNHPGASVRDSVEGEGVLRLPAYPSTAALIRAARDGELPPRLMITVHPERWNQDIAVWAADWALQVVKNGAKRVLKQWRGRQASHFR